MLCREPRKRVLSIFFGVVIFGFGVLAGCDDDDKEGGISNGDSDTESDTKADDSDTQETDTGDGAPGTCISNIVGEIKTSEGEPWAGKLSICMPFCVPLETDKSGKFDQPVPGGSPCKKFDFEGNMAPLHLTIMDSTDSFAAYGAAYTPTQEQVSDQGGDDYELDLGVLVLHGLPEEKVDYTAAAGATVDLSGVSFELPAESLVGRQWDMDIKDNVDVPEESAEIRVFQAPLDTWQPPFDDVGLDALYFIAPRWAKLAGEGVSLSIDPPSGWSEGDKGTLYILADDVPGLGEMNEFIMSNEEGTCSTSTDVLEKEPGGELAECGPVEMVDGRVVTPPIPRLSWVGIKK